MIFFILFITQAPTHPSMEKNKKNHGLKIISEQYEELWKKIIFSNCKSPKYLEKFQDLAVSEIF